MGSGGSALSLFFAAGFAAGGGAAVAVVAPAFGTGGVGVLPSTGSAIIPVINLSINFINRELSYVANTSIYNLEGLRVKTYSQFGANSRNDVFK
jgi:hypothetical protein